MKTQYYGLDFETYCDVNLPKEGFDRYINHPSFKPLVAGVSEPMAKPYVDDFVKYGDSAIRTFKANLERIATEGDNRWVAHNVGFERGVLNWMGVHTDLQHEMLDSAVIARCHGAAGKLEFAAPQLTNIKKLDTGHALIMLFSVPNEKNRGRPFTWNEILVDQDLYDKWEEFKRYCGVDAMAGREIANTYHEDQWADTDRERMYEWDAHQMNLNGWHVDEALVEEMQQRFHHNTEVAVSRFFSKYTVTNEKFFNSHKQMTDFCAARGIRAKSFSADAVDTMIPKIEAAFLANKVHPSKITGYSEVLDFLRTKKELGGSSLTKLAVIKATIGTDGRLRNQYMHCGAGQTYRTSARGVQLQNLKRLGEDMMIMENLFDEEFAADNTDLSINLRQVFTAADPQGKLIVGDFSAVESRGLAWLAGEDWKIDAYREGKDIYKVLSSKFTGIPYDEITKELRKEGKYSELSCGYQAGGQAVKDFMHALGFEVDLPGANERVQNWRSANPNIVELWNKIDRTLRIAVSNGRGAGVDLAHGLTLEFSLYNAPDSLQEIHSGARSMYMRLYNYSKNSTPILTRVFHGVHIDGFSVAYYKPSETKSGALWVKTFKDKKTKQEKTYSIYGGKLSGILTQSLCREMFMNSLNLLSLHVSDYANVKLIGQFHDEIVMEWSPSAPISSGHISLAYAMKMMENDMSEAPYWAEDFPLVADVKCDWRYTK